MNIEKRRHAEEIFLERYPPGFENPDMIEIAKKHRIDKMTSLTQESFVKENFKNPGLIVENMTKVGNRSSMISLFEKPKFRDFVLSMSAV